MLGSFSINFKETGLIFGALIIIIALFYFMNRKQIAREERLRKQIQEFGYPPLEQSMIQEPVVKKRKATPQVLTAYERMTILLDRIDLNKLVQRVHPISEEKQDYANFLIQHIEQEYDFNVSQQLYVSDESWALIMTAKNTIIQNILKLTLRADILNSVSLREELIRFREEASLVELAKSRLRKEVAEFL